MNTKFYCSQSAQTSIETLVFFLPSSVRLDLPSPLEVSHTRSERTWFKYYFINMSHCTCTGALDFKYFQLLSICNFVFSFFHSTAIQPCTWLEQQPFQIHRIIFNSISWGNNAQAHVCVGARHCRLSQSHWANHFRADTNESKAPFYWFMTEWQRGINLNVGSAGFWLRANAKKREIQKYYRRKL